MADICLMIVGLAVLLTGGELLVRGASVVASISGMSKLLVGLTIVSLGTSAPEMAICVGAAWSGTPEIAVGNIVGSNIANVLLILGLTASIFPIVVHRKLLWRQVPIMIGASLLFLFLAMDGVLSSFDGAVLLVSMASFLFWQFRSEAGTGTVSESEMAAIDGVDEDQPEEHLSESALKRLAANTGLILFGCVMLWLGSGWFVTGASEFAKSLGVGPLVIGLTIVALGSSSPEIVTSLLAAKRGYPEMAVGGVVGSNIANLLLVGGATASVSGAVLIPSEAFQFDIPVMLVSSIACLPVFATGHRIDRWEGILFLCCFCVFTVVLFARPMMDEVFPSWHQLLWLFATPLVVATCTALALHKKYAKRPDER